MAQRKPFFKERTVDEIKSLNIADRYIERDLVKRIVDLSPDEALTLRFVLIPGRFRRFPYVETQADASRVCLYHSGEEGRENEMLYLDQPKTARDARETLENPFQIRKRALESLSTIREEEIDLVGRCFRPFARTEDKRLTRIPFYVDFEGAGIRAYEESETQQRAVVDTRYANVAEVARQGARIPVKVASRTQGKKRYPVVLYHVPLIDNPEKRVIAWNIRCQYGNPETEREEGEEPGQESWAKVKYTSDTFTAMPQFAAANFSVISHYVGQGNFIPLEQCQFALPSKFAVEQIWKKLGNNLLVYDPTLQRIDRLRKPHLAEKSIILARTMARGNFAPEEIFWWEPNRDGRIRDYTWKLE